MNAVAHKQKGGFTLEELLIVVAVVGILVALVVTFLQNNRDPHGIRINCMNKQKQIGTAFRVFAADNDDRYPLQARNNLYIVPGSPSGDQVDAASAAAWQVAQAMWNELQNPKILLCWSDRERLSFQTVSDFNGLAGNSNVITTTSFSHPINRNRALSFAFGVAADERRPQGVLVIDRNVNNV